MTSSIRKLQHLIMVAPIIATACGGAKSGPESGPIGQTSRGAQCGPTLDFEPINAFDSPFEWLQQREEAVVFINGTCTGAYLGAVGNIEHLVITAGHCTRVGDEPVVVFNFEQDADGPESFQFGLVIEQSNAPDYALIELFEDPEVAPVRLTNDPTRALVSVQHPRGQPKLVATGYFDKREAGRFFYRDLDTLVGTSGAPIFNEAGDVLGIHAGGDCEENGTNWGWTAFDIRGDSPILCEYEFDDY
ncbi:MAG: serine protease [Myxococcota bacterium]